MAYSTHWSPPESERLVPESLPVNTPSQPVKIVRKGVKRRVRPSIRIVSEFPKLEFVHSGLRQPPGAESRTSSSSFVPARAASLLRPCCRSTVGVL